MSARAIICHMTGAGDGGRYFPNAPLTPEALAEDVALVAEAGAAAVIVHAHDPVTGRAIADPGVYADSVARIRANSAEVLIGFGLPNPAWEVTSEGRISRRFAPDGDIEAALEPLLGLWPDFLYLEAMSGDAGVRTWALPLPVLARIGGCLRRAGVPLMARVREIGHVEALSRLTALGVLPAFPAVVLDPKRHRVLGRTIPAGTPVALSGLVPSDGRGRLPEGGAEHLFVGVGETPSLGRRTLLANLELVQMAAAVIAERSTVLAATRARPILFPRPNASPDQDDAEPA